MTMDDTCSKLYPPDNSKCYLLKLKQVVQDVKNAAVDVGKTLDDLVRVYLECPVRIPAQRFLASFFQGLTDDIHQHVKLSLSGQLLEMLKSDELESSTSEVKSTRHKVDTVSALLENFKLGEQCIASGAADVLKFLVHAEKLFLSQVHDDVPPVKLNEVMHHCHVTMQTLNLVIQKTVVANVHIINTLTQDTKLMATLFNLDIDILKNESFLLDSRCCSAMNAIALIQLHLKCAPPESSAINFTMVPRLLFPGQLKQSETCQGHTVQIFWLTPDLQMNLDVAGQSTLTYLALTFGYIAMSETESVLSPCGDERWFYLDVLLPGLLSQGEKCCDMVSKGLYAKTVNLWTNKLLSVLQSSVSVSLREGLAVKLCGQSQVVQSLLQYVWTHWEDHMDVIRQSAKVVFENVLKIHTKVSSESPSRVDGFVHSLLDRLWTVSWSSRGKFGALISCVSLVGAREMLSLRPDLPAEIVGQLREQALSCYASELYSTLFLTHLQELIQTFSHTSDQTSTQVRLPGKSKKNVLDKSLVTDLHRLVKGDQSMFLHIWTQPMVDAMCSHHRKLKQNIIEYLLPKILKLGDILLHHMVQELANHNAGRGAVIMCLRRARVMGMLKSAPQSSGSDPLWCAQLQTSMLKVALCSLDEQVRLDAFALVTENQKTAEAITTFEFDMVKFFLPSNMNNQSPAYRQTVVALLKKFFFRVKESLGALKRTVKREKQPETHLTQAVHNYQHFLTWMTDHILSELYPGSAFARRTTNLAILSLLTDFFTTESDGFSVPHQLSACHINTLLECLMDTFEESRLEALRVLTTYLTHTGPVWSVSDVPEVLTMTLTLACSTRPQDCDTAVYHLIVLLRQWEKHKETFVDISCTLPSFSYLWQCPPTPSEVIPPAFLQDNGTLVLLGLLLSLLDDQISVAGQSLITAAAQRPMYPTLHCIRYILQEINFRKLPPDSVPVMREFIRRLITSCLLLSKVVSLIVQNSSPEGNVPEEAMLAPSGEQSESLTLSRALVESMPEYLVVCGWRSIKEVSLTLGHLCLQLPTHAIQAGGVEERCGDSLMTLDQVNVIGAHFRQQLLESIHRGAFELAYAGFQLMCQMLWSHPLSAFHQLPSQWLCCVMCKIKSDELQNKLCVTRRSAGVPFFVQAITSSEPATTGRQCFHRVIKELLTLALESSTDAQVHSLNILRALYRDARLGEDVVAYVADGLKASVLGFKSHQWAVRNSATLLLSALMSRMFGVKRSKDETAMSKKNCQTGRMFFHRYPKLYPFLLSELGKATENIGDNGSIHLHPSLYPVLLVLGRLFPSTLEGSDTNLSLEAFIPYIIRCAASPVLKTRVIAARALRPLVRKDQVVSVSSQLLEVLPGTSPKVKGQCLSTSHWHGALLQLHELLEVVKLLSDSQRVESVTFILSQMQWKLWLITRENPCLVSRQASLHVIDLLLDLSGSLGSKVPTDVEGCIRNELTKVLSSVFTVKRKKGCSQGQHPHNVMRIDNRQNQTWIPWYYELERTRAEFLLKYFTQFETSTLSHSNVTSEKGDNPGLSKSPLAMEMVMSLLTSPVYEVRQEVLQTLLAAATGCANVETDGRLAQTEDDVAESEAHNCLDPALVTNTPGHSRKCAAVLQSVCGQLSDHLLDMAWSETHHHCVEKVFLLLASSSAITQFLSTKSDQDILQIFSTLMSRIMAERRIEVKAAMMKFSGCLIPFLHYKISDTEQCLAYDLLSKWTRVLQASCEGDECADLQVACCQVLLQNVHLLLCDHENTLGGMKYNYWNSLSALLQDDDLEVKDLASAVLSAITGLEADSHHPSYALQCLPSVLVTVHGAIDPTGVIRCLITWILSDSETKDSNDERLFDKGEINTYWDQVIFTRHILMTLTSWIGHGIKTDHSEPKMDAKAENTKRASGCSHDGKENMRNKYFTGHHVLKNNESSLKMPEVDFSQALHDKDLVEFLLRSVMKVSGQLAGLQKVCSASDRYLNVGQYQSLCQAMFRGRALQSVLRLMKGHEEREVGKALDDLTSLLSCLIQEFHLGNTLIS